MTKMIMNEKIIDRKEKLINIEDRGYQFGDGVYEVIGIYNGKLFALDEHLNRLQRSAREIQLKIPFSNDDIKKNLERMVEINEVTEGIVYLQVTRGIANRAHQFPDSNVLPVLVAYTKHMKKTDVENEGATAILTEDIRWLRCDIKSLNLLPNVLSKQKAVNSNSLESILHRGGTVTEGSSSNVFIVKNNELFTHPVNNLILNGITRQHVIKLCKSLNIKVNEQTFTINELLEADEVFVTATKFDIVPILKIDNQTIGSGKPGDITKAVLENYRQLIQHEAS